MLLLQESSSIETGMSLLMLFWTVDIVYGIDSNNEIIEKTCSEARTKSRQRIIVGRLGQKGYGRQWHTQQDVHSTRTDTYLRINTIWLLHPYI